MTLKSIKNQRGLGMIELMVSMVIMIIVLGGTIMVFTEQQTRIKDENDTSKVRAKGRHAIKLLAREVRMAGFGLPPGLGITNAATGTIGFDVNIDNIVAYADTSSTITGTTITVTSSTDAAQFSNGDDVAVYNPNTFDLNAPEGWDKTTVSSVSGADINVAVLGPGYVFGTFAKTVTVSQYLPYVIQLTSYTHDGRTHYKIERVVDGTEIRTLVNDVAPAGLTFEYFDFAGGTVTTDLNAIQRIGITLNMLDPKNPDAMMEFKTDVQVRNSNL